MTFQTIQPHIPGIKPLYRRSDFSERVTWDALLREGHLLPLTEDVARHRSTSETLPMRVSALEVLRSEGAVIADSSAAWVYAPQLSSILTGGHPHWNQVIARRTMHRGPVRLIYSRGVTRPPFAPFEVSARRATLTSREVVSVTLPQDELSLITTPTRTALDLATRYEEHQVHDIIVELVHHGARIADALQRLSDATRWPNRDRTSRTLVRAYR